MFLWICWRWLFGWVRFEAEGGLCERFLTLLAPEPIEIWDIRREGGRLIACCKARQYRRLRPFARRTGTRLRVCKKSGFPFWNRRILRRPGLPVGMAICVALYILAMGRIWVIDTTLDSDPALAATIREKLAPQGVRIGAAIEDVDVAALRMNAIAAIEDVNWLSVHFDGCVAHVEARRQKSGVMPPEGDEASDLVAAQDGVIRSMRVTGGQPMVQVGEAVVKGDLLVSGVVETTADPLIHRATGDIVAQTERQVQVTVSLTETESRATGAVWRQPTLCFFGIALPLYTNVAIPKTCERQVRESFWTLRGVTLPVGVRETVYTEYVPGQVTHTKAEAEILAETRLQETADRVLGDAQRLSCRTQGIWTEDRYVLTGTYECLENIAREVPHTEDRTEEGKDDTE
ncbi:MAG: sporulation protein YqfD [Clostridia bacterium]|nr:sporulation protein YqfD [Clostridia bacterium]